MGRPKKAQKSQVATGWLSKPKDVPQPIVLMGRKGINSLDDIFHDSLTKYQVAQPDDYELTLHNMTFVELQQECTRVGIFPQYETERMIELLMKEFIQYQLLQKGPQIKRVELTPTKESRAIMDVVRSKGDTAS